MSLKSVVIGSIAVVAIVVEWVRSYLSADRRPWRPLPAPRVWLIGELPEKTRGRVVGEAQPLDGVLRGPLTGRPCLCYVVTIEEHGLREKETLVRESDGVPFLLVDSSGHALVDTAGAKVSLTIDSASWSGTFDDPTPAEAAFLEKHGCVSKGALFNKRLHYTEAVIAPGERIEILGMLVREPAPQGPDTDAYRSAPRTQLRLTGSALSPLEISDELSRAVS